MRAFPVCLILLARCALAVPSDATPRACTVREMNDVRYSTSAGDLLVTTGVVQFVIHRHFVLIEDETGRTFFFAESAPTPGDRIEVVCRKHVFNVADKSLRAQRISVLGKQALTPPREIRLRDLDEREDDLRLVTVSGTVVSVSADPIDALYDILLLKDDAARLPLFVQHAEANRRYAGAVIRATARYHRIVSGHRRFSGPFLSGEDAAISVVRPPRTDPFSAPLLDPGGYTTPSEVAAMDARCLEGRVLASWDGNKFMLGIGDLFANVQVADGESLPPIGSRIRAVGSPETDLYKINLAAARWKTLSSDGPPEEPPLDIAADRIFRPRNGTTEIDPSFNGKLVRLSGTVRGLPPAGEGGRRRFSLDAGAHRFPVDASACPEAFARLRPGAVVEVTGRCLLEAGVWRRHDVFPKISGITILMRTAADARILREPPWWTPARLTAAIFVLAALLIGVLVWNRFLNRLVERRGRQLYRADLEREREALRVAERTHLAVELHDALSQNLSAVACQISAANSTVGNGSETQSLLKTAERMLQSSRTELTRCLSDLRGNALEEPDFTRAIANVLRLLPPSAAVRVRFNVPRKLVDETTAHAILCIVRELATNAVRHGAATEILVAGELHGRTLSFSVRDNGTGFDPARRKGAAEGHFGLAGVADRIRRLDGTFDITSAPGRGTRAVAAFPIGNAQTEGRKRT